MSGKHGGNAAESRDEVPAATALLADSDRVIALVLLMAHETRGSSRSMLEDQLGALEDTLPGAAAGRGRGGRGYVRAGRGMVGALPLMLPIA
jgi:hypothetical protein